VSVAPPTRPDFDWVVPALAAIRGGGGDCLGGFYNHNYIVPHAGQSYVLRLPIAGREEMDLRALTERVVLDYLALRGFPAPRVLYEDGVQGVAVHSVVPGRALDAIYPEATPLPDWIAPTLGLSLWTLHRLGPPPRLDDAPTSACFFAHVLDHIASVHARYLSAYGPLFAALGIPLDPLAVVRPLAIHIGDRASTLVHGDVHRKNLMLDSVTNALVFLDWELAIVGDPAYDLAVHLHKMRYTPMQERVVVTSYLHLCARDACMRAPRPASWDAAIATYRAMEHIKSALVDAVRTARLLQGGAMQGSARARAVARYGRKLAPARALWGLPDDLGQDVLRALMETHGRPS